MLQHIILIILLLISSHASSQEKDELGIITGKGNVYLTNGETLNGIIHYPTSDFRKINFQKFMDEESTKLKIPAFNAFTIELDSFIVLYDFKIQSNELRNTKISVNEGIVEVSVVGDPLSLYIHHSFQSRTSASFYGTQIKYEPILSYILCSNEFGTTIYNTLTTLKPKKLIKELDEFFGKYETLRPLIVKSINHPEEIRKLVIQYNKLKQEK